MTNNKGIDYSGPGATCNRSPETGISYGIIPASEIGQAWCDSAEPNPVNPSCPECGGTVAEYNEDDHGEFPHGQTYGQHHCHDYACPHCQKAWSNDDCFPDKSSGYYLDDGEYKAFDDKGGDVWFTESPYYTRAQFCFPWAPGACYLSSECPDGEKAYCPGHDWFDGGRAPYRVFRVSDDSEVFPDAKA